MIVFCDRCLTAPLTCGCQQNWWNVVVHWIADCRSKTLAVVAAVTSDDHHRHHRHRRNWDAEIPRNQASGIDWRDRLPVGNYSSLAPGNPIVDTGATVDKCASVLDPQRTCFDRTGRPARSLGWRTLFAGSCFRPPSAQTTIRLPASWRKRHRTQPMTRIVKAAVYKLRSMATILFELHAVATIPIELRTARQFHPNCIPHNYSTRIVCCTTIPSKLCATTTISSELCTVEKIPSEYYAMATILA